MDVLIRIEHLDTGLGVFMMAYDGHFGDDYSETSWYKKHNEMNSARDIDGFTKEHYCGYLNGDSFKKFNSQRDLKTFINKGFRIYEITLREIIEDKQGYQGLFLPIHIIEKKDITNLVVN